ncbi:unnamed protein product [Camellia sinensis]
MCDKDKMMREYGAQLDAERAIKLARGRNHSSSKSNHKKDKDKDLKKRSSKKRKEASLLNITDQACALFTPSEVVLLEWTDDLELFILKGYGNALNYQMGVPLLEDVVQSMYEEHAPGCYEKARLRFAHAETLLPFSCLIGLFLEESGCECFPFQKVPPVVQGGNKKYLLQMESCVLTVLIRMARCLAFGMSAQ